MRVNEVEISGVPDEPAVKKTLKNKREKKKPSLKKVVNDVPPVSATYDMKQFVLISAPQVLL